MAVHALFLACAVAGASRHLKAEPELPLPPPPLGAQPAAHAPADVRPLALPPTAAKALRPEAQNHTVPQALRIPGVGPNGEVPVLSAQRGQSIATHMLRAMITEPIAMNKLRNVDSKNIVQWRKPMVFTGGKQSTRPTAYMLSPKPLFDAKAPVLWQLGFEPVRVPPVHTELSCIGNLTSRTGTFLGHRAAWQKIAEVGSKGLILEADWSIGDMQASNAEKLAEMLDELRKRPDDLTKVGGCGSLCNTAYFMSAALAKQVQDEDPCKHTDGTDVFTRQLCYQQVALRNGQYASCHIVTGGTLYAKSQGLYGSGIIFQDRKKIRGLHDQNNQGRYNASQEELDTV